VKKSTPSQIAPSIAATNSVWTHLSPPSRSGQHNFKSCSPRMWSTFIGSPISLSRHNCICWAQPTSIRQAYLGNANIKGYIYSWPDSIVNHIKVIIIIVVRVIRC
jgi:hypothetical protein